MCNEMTYNKLVRKFIFEMNIQMKSKSVLVTIKRLAVDVEIYLF